MGKRGGSRKSEVKTAAARANANKPPKPGKQPRGRPKKSGGNEMAADITSENYSSIREMSHSGRGIVVGKKDGGWYWAVDPDTAGRAPHGPHKTAQAAIDDAKEFIDAA